MLGTECAGTSPLPRRVGSSEVIENLLLTLSKTVRAGLTHNLAQPNCSAFGRLAGVQIAYAICDSRIGLAKKFTHNPLDSCALRSTRRQLRSERKSLADSIEAGPGRIDSHFGLAKMLTPEE